MCIFVDSRICFQVEAFLEASVKKMCHCTQQLLASKVEVDWVNCD